MNTVKTNSKTLRNPVLFELSTFKVGETRLNMKCSGSGREGAKIKKKYWKQWNMDLGGGGHEGRKQERTKLVKRAEVWRTERLTTEDVEAPAQKKVKEEIKEAEK